MPFSYTDLPDHADEFLARMDVQLLVNRSDENVYASGRNVHLFGDHLVGSLPFQFLCNVELARRQIVCDLFTGQMVMEPHQHLLVGNRLPLDLLHQLRGRGSQRHLGRRSRSHRHSQIGMYESPSTGVFRQLPEPIGAFIGVSQISADLRASLHQIEPHHRAARTARTDLQQHLDDHISHLGLPVAQIHLRLQKAGDQPPIRRNCRK